MGDLPQSNSVDSSNKAKKTFLGIEYGIGGVIVGLIVFIIILIILHYTNTINLSFMLPKNIVSKFPQKNLTIQERAKNAGYSIVWQGDKSDTTGRTILGDSKKLFNKTPEKFGWISDTIYDSNAVVIKGTGIFKEWQTINGSSDEYMILYDPVAKKDMKARVLIEKSVLSSVFGDKELKGEMRTRVFVENLDFVSNLDNNGKPKKDFASQVGFFYELKQGAVKKIIRKNDVIVIWTLIFTDEEYKKTKKVAKFDNTGNYLVSDLILRRFGGIGELKKEL